MSPTRKCPSLKKAKGESDRTISPPPRSSMRLSVCLKNEGKRLLHHKLFGKSASLIPSVTEANLEVTSSKLSRLPRPSTAPQFDWKEAERQINFEKISTLHEERSNRLSALQQEAQTRNLYDNKLKVFYVCTIMH